MSKHGGDPTYEPRVLIKSFKMPPGSKSRKLCEKVIAGMKEEKNRELAEQNPKHLGTPFDGEVIMTGEEVRVNLYRAIDKDAVTFGIQYERLRLGQE